MKEKFTTTVSVKGKGESKARAFSDALRRERRTFSVELEVTVNVTAINPDKVDFVTQ